MTDLTGRRALWTGRLVKPYLPVTCLRPAEEFEVKKALCDARDAFITDPEKLRITYPGPFWLVDTPTQWLIGTRSIYVPYAMQSMLRLAVSAAGDK